MSTDKRARQKANRASRVEAAEAAAAKARFRGRMMTYGTIAAVVVLAIVGIAILTADDDDSEAGVDPSTTTPLATTTTVSFPEPGVSAPPLGGSIEGTTECPAKDESSERITSFAAAPPTCIDQAASYSAVIDTTYGEFTIDLDAAQAPMTVNNFVVLARYGYYNGAPFHRIIPGFVIQAGDAVGEPLGTGNPGYSIDDELPQAGAYEIGSVAMANSGPNTNGSQFFVITGEQGVALPPSYSLFGSVVDGLDVAMQIEATETTLGDAPVDEIIINSVTILEA